MRLVTRLRALAAVSGHYNLTMLQPEAALLSVDRRLLKKDRLTQQASTCVPVSPGPGIAETVDTVRARDQVASLSWPLLGRTAVVG